MHALTGHDSKPTKRAREGVHIGRATASPTEDTSHGGHGPAAVLEFGLDVPLQGLGVGTQELEYGYGWVPTRPGSKANTLKADTTLSKNVLEDLIVSYLQSRCFPLHKRIGCNLGCAGINESAGVAASLENCDKSASECACHPKLSRYDRRTEVTRQLASEVGGVIRARAPRGSHGHARAVGHSRNAGAREGLGRAAGRDDGGSNERGNGSHGGVVGWGGCEAGWNGCRPVAQAIGQSGKYREIRVRAPSLVETVQV
eukprot:8076910-Pyramimonas_sp.AAC.1